MIHRRGPSGIECGLGVIAVGALIFVAVVLGLPPSRGRTLAAMAVPMTTVAVLAFWWLRWPRASRLTKVAGTVSALLAGAYLALVPQFPGSVFAVLWGFPLTVAAGFIAYAIARRSPSLVRVLGGLAVALTALLPWALVQADGASGQMMPNLVWEWSAPARGRSPGLELSPEDALQARLRETPLDSPGFRGPNGDGVVPEKAVAELELDWANQAPTECWRQPLGPGWSSFAVVGEAACTQDQNGELERVLCLEVSSGRPLWVHSSRARFDELAGGPGPRATPLIHDGRLYALGASGRLDCLDARSGKPIWSAELAADNKQTPEWGFASSPVVWNDILFVSPAGIGGIRLQAMDARTGEILWRAPGKSPGYASPRIARFANTVQVLLFDGEGLAGWEAASGEKLWEFHWPTGQPAVAQPELLGEDAVVFGMGYGRGTKRLRVERVGPSWEVVEQWSTVRLKPKFNGFIAHRGHLYGLDEGILTSLNAASGERNWKGGRYGYGQLLLVGDLLLIVAESGDLVIVNASPLGHEERFRIPALSGKSWSYPALGGGRLLVRNASEAVCFDLRRVRDPN